MKYCQKHGKILDNNICEECFNEDALKAYNSFFNDKYINAIKEINEILKGCEDAFTKCTSIRKILIKYNIQNF